MNILLVSPFIPDTYWSFRHALKFVSKKAVSPPLGLLTIASMLPAAWKRKLVDLNVRSLKDSEIEWADYVFIGAMSVQAASTSQVVERCRKQGKIIVAGGPLFTGDPEAWSHIDHLVLQEAEITLPRFLADLETGHPRKIYQTEEFADIQSTPPPDFSLINVSDYAQVSLQYSRGCPYDCEFCEITALLGRKVRLKSTRQVIQEMDLIYQTGFRGNLFFVDDNFIGNRKRLKQELLPAIGNWNRERKYPYTFTTEASIDLSDDPELLSAMAYAGFEKVFVGIETPDEESLKECNKYLNQGRNLLESVEKIQAAGIEVSAGFIVGFDHDTSGIFQRQIDFIQRSGIITAMVGLLNAPSRTRLYKRLKEEGRILWTHEGDNTNYSMNFVPKMKQELLLEGYQKILDNIYSSKAYYLRLKGFLTNFKPRSVARARLSKENMLALLRSIFYLGIVDHSRLYYWKLVFWSLSRRPDVFPLAVTYSIYGYHFRKVYRIDT
ncbi:MAG: B12-binding domain-containing radical SAM protein [Bacteroidales bacterium]|nr:B12-binding domain-containing radical SAM protein [Bacteroidales bacterium]